MTTALIADDEPLLREALAKQLAQAWPELSIVAQARNGREAIELFEATQPDICFLDIHMPGVSGLEAAREIGRRAHLVFVTAYDEYAVKAFEAGVLDYLIKPVELSRLAETVTRLKERVASDAPSRDAGLVLNRLIAHLSGGMPVEKLRWIRAQVGTKIRILPVEDIDYFRSDAKYTIVAWRNETGEPSEALVRTPLKELASQLDSREFAQIHRSAIVNLRAVSHLVRGDADTGILHLKNRSETLPVSRANFTLFRPM